jgi:polyisoprenoid-binding protein YceI
MYRALIPALTLALLSTTALAQKAPAKTTTWTIDTSHSEVGFKVKHLAVTWTKGKFNTFSGTVRVHDGDITQAPLIDVEIDPASIDTGNSKRDKHLRSPDFFDVKKFPKMIFKANKAKRVDDGGFEVMGELTMHGVTKPVTLKVEGFDAQVKTDWGATLMGGTATATLNRKDFGLTWGKVMETGAVVVGEKVKIILELELVKQVAKKTKG